MKMLTSKKLNFSYLIIFIFLVFNLNIYMVNSVLEDWPNTYTFTKALAENMILTDKNQLPISIFRPSIGKDFMFIV